MKFKMPNMIYGSLCLALLSSLSFASDALPAGKIENSLDMRMVYIKPGSFTMGSPKSEAKRESQETQHEVELTKGYYIGKYEVTLGEFKKFVIATNYKTDAEKDGRDSYGVMETGSKWKFDFSSKYNWKDPGFEQSDNHPVVLVTWNDAQAFCRWLSKKEKKTYRLPTEAEWEYASRAGTDTAYAYGEDSQALRDYGNAWEGSSVKPKDGHRYSATVGHYKANAIGLHDMHGNVWEWCQDWYVPNSYTEDKQTNPSGPSSGKARVQRGGGWSSSAHRCRSAARIGRDPATYRGSYLGFRIVLESSDNPRTEKAVDVKLNKEFEYLVYDLGKDVELKLVKIPAKGQSFTIGSSVLEQENVVKKYYKGKRKPHLDFENEHRVTLTDDYFIGQYEVTRGQFRRFIEETGYITDPEKTDGGYGWNQKLKKFEGRDKTYSWKHYGSSQTDDYPVTNISRDDARRFCDWLAKKGSFREVRLPGEAEWEFACRAGSQSRYSFGDEEKQLTKFANVADGTWAERFSRTPAIPGKDGHAFAAPVGQFMPNAFGVYDMHGNVWEWCEGFYGKYEFLPKVRNALQAVSLGEKRPVMRGGAWYTHAEACRSSKRWRVGAGSSRYGGGGFRVICIQ